jgi:hypothetical protein
MCSLRRFVNKVRREKEETDTKKKEKTLISI